MSLLGLIFVIGMILYGLNTKNEATNQTNDKNDGCGCVVAIILFLFGLGIVSTAVSMLFH